MKNKSLILQVSALLLACSSFASAQLLSQPIGSLEALKKIVNPGEKVGLDWQISYPVFNFNETDSEVTVRFITTALGPVSKLTFGTRLNGVYTEFYEGISEDNEAYALSPGTIVRRQFVPAGQEIEFLARHHTHNLGGDGWVSSVADVDSNLVIVLKDGDPVPTLAPPGQRSVAEILAPYSKNGIVDIGPNQKLICFEIFTANTNSLAYDLQDLVILVSHEQAPLSNLSSI